ncbi:alpha/beta fold hydrolase [Novosphingobium piscinae]|uniref:Alpha/beta hydrolase n=1 Tax=Novosphingobium piscinae TaxID=1507448 RepID=A0A7X1FVS0_9SPHN|nr:alpha/beta hydrolase [Novosphingobium piscinae]MBC2667894.1 alpha/beta hydrolase [Novosphingobium piscinae]
MSAAAILTGALGSVAALAGGLVLISFLLGRQAERRVPPLGGFLELPDARLHYLTMGAGAPVVLVHGLTGQLRDFTYALAGKLAQDHQVFLFDRPGSGHSTWRRGGDRGLAAHAGMLHAFIAGMDLRKPMIVGHSLGGAVALKCAIDHPDIASGLALICPLTQPIGDAPPMFAPLLIESDLKRWLLSVTLAVPVGKLKRAEIARMLFSPDPVPTDYATRGGAMLKDRASVFRTASREVLAVQAEMQDIADRLTEVHIPVSILYGREDAVLDPVLHGQLTAGKLPKADLSMIDGGHMIPATRPDAVAAWIRRASASRQEQSGAA